MSTNAASIFKGLDVAENLSIIHNDIRPGDKAKNISNLTTIVKLMHWLAWKSNVYNYIANMSVLDSMGFFAEFPA